MTNTQDDPQVVIRDAEGNEESFPFSQLFRRLLLSIVPVEMSVSCAETFQLRQYESKNYHSSMRFDLRPMFELIRSIKDQDMQVQARNALGQVLREQVFKSDNFQRQNIRWLAGLDGMPGASGDIKRRRENLEQNEGS